MKAVDILRTEHNLISHALDQTDAALRSFDFERLGRLLEFFSTFVDGVHHAKEEEVLFPAVVERLREMARGPVDAMTKEHFLARAYIRSANRTLTDAKAGNHVARSLFEGSIESYVALMRSHIQKENDVLFPFAERMLDSKLDDGMVRDMTTIENECAPPEDIRALRSFIDEPNVVRSSFIDARTLSSDIDEPTQSVDDTALNAKAGGVLFEQHGHQNIWLHDFQTGLAVQANQFLIINNGEGMLLDPGGPKVYPDVFAETTLRLRGGKLRYIFLSHQDPDIGTSLNAWLMDTKATAHVSKLWVRFLPHFGIDRLLENRLVGIPDEGCRMPLGSAELLILPAHFLHSAGNFHVYDPTSRILYSGDLGASIASEDSVVVDFDTHARTMLGFHQRYMASGSAVRAWVEMVRHLDIETIAPQHGAIFRGREMVERFLDWCMGIECGVDLQQSRYRIPA